MNLLQAVALATATSLVTVSALAAPPYSLSGAPFESMTTLPRHATFRSDAQPARAIVLPAPRPAEKRATGATSADKRQPLQIGFARSVPPSVARIELSGLTWEPLGNGARAVRLSVESPSAAGLRVQILTDAGLEGLRFRFAGSHAPDAVEAMDAVGLAAANGWSPMLEGSLATIEIEAAASVDLHGKALRLPLISHLELAGVDLAPGRIKDLPQIGASGSCNIDVACVANPSVALQRAIAASAQIVFTTEGRTLLCSGTLINSTSASGQPTQIPYVVTANHCVGESMAAATINFLWFFQAASCNGASVAPSFEKTIGGASLLYASYDVDLTLVRMNQDPPPGAFMLGWDAGPVFPGTDVVAIHHPQGDLKKYSDGRSIDYAHDFDDVQSPGEFVPQGSYLRIRWSHGTTEPGSSGSGVFSRGTDGEYRLRGVLHGGDASCQDLSGLDYFSRFELAYAALSEPLAGVMQPLAGDNAVEYYNVDLDHYFITSFADETGSIDTGGAGRGWVRTGHSFSIQRNQAAPVPAQVCRFYGNPALNPATGARRGPNSHFYTANPAECAQVKLDQGWVFEAIAFDIDVPTGAGCASGTTPVLRAYNNGFTTNDSNHRYTTDPQIYQFMLTQGWSGESTVMCAP